MRIAQNAIVQTIAAAILALSTPAFATEDCPTAQSGKDGFVVERSGSSVTEVFHVDDTLVRTVMRSGGRALLETTQFQGLLQLDRIDTRPEADHRQGILGARRAQQSHQLRPRLCAQALARDELRLKHALFPLVPIAHRRRA
jgi:hypothetical protein